MKEKHMTNTAYYKDQFKQLQDTHPEDALSPFRKKAFAVFNKNGLPTYKDEDWKYTSAGSLFDHEFKLSGPRPQTEITAADVDAVRLPGNEEANEIVFVNGFYRPELSTIRSGASDLQVLSLEDAAKGDFKDLVAAHLNQSSTYLRDGIHALNTSFIDGGVFIHAGKGKEPEHPVYLYHILDARQQNVLAQPRSLIYAGENSRLRISESYTTLGISESLHNEVMEVVVRENAYIEYYKIQNDRPNASQINTTHFSQLGRSYVHTVVVTLNGGIVRNNMNLVLDAAGNETHLYGLYLLKGKSHADNHTLIDNRQPNCFSNQFYKGIAADDSTAVFNGRIIVQPDAQKTNAYQSNKNILLSDQATINTKPQLEIFADDVKCSHGCTIGQLDEEALFYLRARGIPKEQAEIMLLQAFAEDIVAQVKLEPLRGYLKKLIYSHLAIQ